MVDARAGVQWDRFHVAKRNGVTGGAVEGAVGAVEAGIAAAEACLHGSACRLYVMGGG